MSIKFSKNVKLIVCSLLVAVVLLWAVLGGLSRGKNLAQANMIVQTAQNSTKALELFYNDQDRYPSALEFSDQNTMLNYLSNFPLPEFISPSCSQTFVYKRLSLNAFELNFCLPTAVGNYQAGWNTVNGSPSPSS